MKGFFLSPTVCMLLNADARAKKNAAHKPPVSKNVVVSVGLLQDPIDAWFLQLSERPVWDISLVTQHLILIHGGIRWVWDTFAEQGQELEVV
jgi:hypothetical protein